MALFVKDDKKSEDGLPSLQPAGSDLTASSTRGVPDVQAHLGKGSRVEGKLTFEGSVRIDGQVEGEIAAQETVLIGDTAELTAQIQANAVVVHGRVTGDITARKRVELRAPATVVGNITTPSLVINDGVVFEGHCAMGSAVAARSERGEKRIALFPTEERSGATRRPSEAAG